MDCWVRLPSVWPDNAVIEARAGVQIYPGALHGFNCWSRGSYQPAAAALAHGRSVAFLAQALHGARAHHQARGSPCSLTLIVAPGGVVICTR